MEVVAAGGEKWRGLKALLWKLEGFCKLLYEEHPQNLKRAASTEMKNYILTNRKNGF